MPQVTTGQIYNTAISPASVPRDVDFWSDSSSHHSRDFQLHLVSDRKTPPRQCMRNCRNWLWSLAVLLKTFGILIAFVLAIRAGWPGGVAATATLAGILLRFILEATSRGD